MVWYGLVLMSVGQTAGSPGIVATLPLPMAQAVTSIQTKRVVMGSGDPVVAGDRVTVHFSISASGRTLADSVRSGLPYSFVVGSGTEPAFLSEAVKGLRAKGLRECVVPWQLAGGSKGVPPTLPPQTDIHVVVKLIRVDKPGVKSAQ